MAQTPFGFLQHGFEHITLKLVVGIVCNIKHNVFHCPTYTILKFGSKEYTSEEVCTVWI